MFPVLVSGQEADGLSIHAGESFYVHPVEDIAIFADISNSGSFGSYPGAIINFFGQRWTNKPGSRMPDESTGGISGVGGDFRFTAVSGATQYINNQTNSQPVAGFSGMSVANSRNVIAEGTELVVRNRLSFERGRVILGSSDLIIAAAGTITGYNESSYVVTGTGISGGSLVRNTSGQQQSDMVFPVGTTVSSYTPASVRYTGMPQTIKLRVFENVYEKGLFGTPDQLNYVTKTWNLAFSNADPNAVLNINLQHNSSDEGTQFAAGRSESFISRFQAAADKWDILPAAGVASGTITSGTVRPNAHLSTRINVSGINQHELFSKSILKNNAIAGLRIPAGISPNSDGLNDRFVIENLKPTDKVGLEIYNRWQSLVFRDSNYKNTFDGTGNQSSLINSHLPNGTYYYILHVNNEKPVTGYIIINR